MEITGRLRSRLQRLRQQLRFNAVPASSPQTAEEMLAADPECWPEWMASHQSDPIGSPRNQLPTAAGCLEIDCCGFAWHELGPHLWLQRLPLIDLELWSVEPSLSHGHRITLLAPKEMRNPEAVPVRIAINLEFPPLDRAHHWLTHLRAHHLIWDPDIARVNLLRALGLKADWLNPKGPSNHWLQSSGATDPDLWSKWLGLPAPNPDHLLVLGQAGRPWELASAAEAMKQQHQSSNLFDPVDSVPIDYLPGWPELIVETPMEGLARAGWLQTAAYRAIRLVQAGSLGLPNEWHLLSECRLEPLCLQDSSTPEELRARHAGQSLVAFAEERLSPDTETCWEWTSGQPAHAAVLVSLYNYCGRIEAALKSVVEQTAGALELIVVDDASTDDGAAVVASWMEACQKNGNHPFVRLLLLQHSRNAGLAVARNSAFNAARASWCFVLDADNALYPRAVEICLALAEAGSKDLAVVHPLLAVEVESGRPDEQRSLVSTASWQRARLSRENVVDAMALVRWQAWKSVQGYCHIEGGWEDYDFWCKLIGAGWHGVQCPQVLAVYRSHDESMSHTATNRAWRALSRTLQARHPWLMLPLANS